MENQKVYIYNPLQRKNNIGRRTGKVISKKNKQILTGKFDDYLTDSDEEESINITLQAEKSIGAEDKIPEISLAEAGKVSVTKNTDEKKSSKQGNVKNTVRAASQYGLNSSMKVSGRVRVLNPLTVGSRFGRRTGIDVLAGKSTPPANFSQYLSDASDISLPLLPTPERSSCVSPLSKVNQTKSATRGRSPSISPASLQRVSISSGPSPVRASDLTQSDALVFKQPVTKITPDFPCVNNRSFQNTETKINMCNLSSLHQNCEPDNITDEVVLPHVDDNTAITVSSVQVVDVSGVKNKTKLRTSTEGLAVYEDHNASITRPIFGHSSHHLTNLEVGSSLLKVSTAQSLSSHSSKNVTTDEINNDGMKSVNLGQSGLNGSSRHLDSEEVDNNNKASSTPHLLTFSSKPLTVDKVDNIDLTNVPHSLISNLNKHDVPIEKDLKVGTRVNEPVSACSSQNLSTDEEGHSSQVAQPISSHSTERFTTNEVDNDRRPRVMQSMLSDSRKYAASDQIDGGHSASTTQLKLNDRSKYSATAKVDEGCTARVAQPMLDCSTKDFTNDEIDTDHHKASFTQPSHPSNNLAAVEVNTDHRVSTSQVIMSHSNNNVSAVEINGGHSVNTSTKLIMNPSNKHVAVNEADGHRRLRADESLSRLAQCSNTCQVSGRELGSTTKPLLSHSLKHYATNEVGSDHTAGAIRPASCDTIKSPTSEKVINDHAVLANLNVSNDQGLHKKSLLLAAEEHRQAPSSCVVDETKMPIVALTSLSSSDEVRPTSVPMSLESSQASAPLKNAQGLLIEPHLVDSQLGIVQKKDGQNLLPLPQRQRGNSSANSIFLKPAAALNTTVSILADNELTKVQSAKSSKVGQLHDTEMNVESSRKQANIPRLDMNFGGDITGSVSHSEKAIPGQFYGIKKKLSFSSALADNELIKKGSMPNAQAGKKSDKVNNQRLSRQSIVASLCSSFSFRPDLVSSRRESQILEQHRKSGYGLNDSSMSEEEFVIVEEEDKEVSFKVPGLSRRSQAGRPKGTSGRRKVQPPDEDDTTAIVLEIEEGEKASHKNNISTRISEIKGQEDLKENNSKSLVELKRKTRNARSASSKKEEPGKVTEPNSSPLMNHHPTCPPDSIDNAVVISTLNQIPGMDFTEAAHVLLENTNTITRKNGGKSKQSKNTCKGKLQKINHKAKLSKSIDEINEPAPEFNTNMVKSNNDHTGDAEKKPKLKTDIEDNLQSNQSYVTIQVDQVKGNETFKKQVREKRKRAVTKSLLVPEKDFGASTSVSNTTVLIQSPEMGQKQVDQIQENDVGNNKYGLEEDNSAATAVVSLIQQPEMAREQHVSRAKNLKTEQRPEKVRRSLFSKSNLSVFTDNNVNDVITDSVDVSAINLTISKPVQQHQQQEQSVDAVRESGRVRTVSNQESAKSKPQKRQQNGRNKKNTKRGKMKGQRKQEQVKKMSQWLDCPVPVDPPRINTSEAQSADSPHLEPKMNNSIQNAEVVGSSKSQSHKRSQVTTQSSTDPVHLDTIAPSENSPVVPPCFESSGLSFIEAAGTELSPNISKSQQTAGAKRRQSGEISLAGGPGTPGLVGADIHAPSESPISSYQNLESSRLSFVKDAGKELSPNVSKSKKTAGLKRRQSRKISLAGRPSQSISTKQKRRHKVSTIDESSESVGKKTDTADKRKLAPENEIVEGVTPVKLRLLSSLPNLTPKSGISFRRSRKFSPVNDVSRMQSVAAERSLGAAGAEENMSLYTKPSDTPVVLTSCLKKKKTSSRQRKGRRVRISNFIGQREISLDDSENAAENNQDQTTLTSLLSPSASPVHYFDTTTNNNYNSDTEVTLPDLNYKIIQPTDSPHPGMRRSNRTRVMRLDGAVGEGIIYRRDSTGMGLVVHSIQPSVGVAKLKAKEEQRKRKLRQQKLRAMNVPAKSKKRLSVHVKLDEVIDNVTEVPVINPDTSELVRLELIGRSNSATWYGPNLEPVTGSEPVATCLLVRQPSFTTGDIHLRPLADKQLEETEHTLVFYVICGKIQLMIHEVTTTVETGDSFFVPRGTSYSLKNLRRQVAKLHFIDINDANESRYITSRSFAAT